MRKRKEDLKEKKKKKLLMASGRGALSKKKGALEGGKISPIFKLRSSQGGGGYLPLEEKNATPRA